MSTKLSPLNDSTVNVVSSGTTDRGTKILRKTDNTMDKNSFLKILSAQLSNLDPTQNQDSSAYVSQMAQFASMEQMQNLNTTMSDSSYQQMVGRTVITNEKDDNGSYIQGYVTQVLKESGGTYLNMLVNGKEAKIAVENIIGTVQTNDSNTNANSRTALNSDFLAASALANKEEKVVIATLDDNKKTVLIKGKITGAYIDTVSGPTVKIKVDILDDNGKPTGETKTYDYGDIVRAGDLADDDMKVNLNNNTANGSTSETGTNSSSNSNSSGSGTTTNSSSTGTNTNAGTASNTGSTSSDGTVNTISSATSDSTAAENAILSKIAGV
ncbi:flagellar hook capping FlgD N-terminal domain-containing protein [Clostridium beijerinckii]|uniref:Basal-body rod modification protein FlgD n=1 Tax=Clostridium beijerinckii TaxID=1520 RepID=A0AAX0B8C1_CLOBE|nr:flagellar hook capping FlgD N-terminal domain-containing protein [Clostridium beijerinckii]MBC2455883.1 flagellar hook capping protein [Clostridium beijerinckii]MBC2474688.1 flagellar hook capping protein [Clostridium beijerinckii]NOV61838.1 flagellar basal-body rod modification protein FlgD [Clostridium beijerinckii]NOV68666.1 flagellar basal-body rod modification protein FlgD [Clostridium beijerinckii]NOW05975.1 flagellar basal-body rod modification protein FlgD [Clostridium beijerinckii]